MIFYSLTDVVGILVCSWNSFELTPVMLSPEASTARKESDFFCLCKLYVGHASPLPNPQPIQAFLTCFLFYALSFCNPTVAIEFHLSRISPVKTGTMQPVFMASHVSSQTPPPFPHLTSSAAPTSFVTLLSSVVSGSTTAHAHPTIVSDLPHPPGE